MTIYIYIVYYIYLGYNVMISLNNYSWYIKSMNLIINCNFPGIRLENN